MALRFGFPAADGGSLSEIRYGAGRVSAVVCSVTDHQPFRPSTLGAISELTIYYHK